LLAGFRIGVIDVVFYPNPRHDRMNRAFGQLLLRMTDPWRLTTPAEFRRIARPFRSLFSHHVYDEWGYSPRGEMNLLQTFTNWMYDRGNEIAPEATRILRRLWRNALPLFHGENVDELLSRYYRADPDNIEDVFAEETDSNALDIIESLCAGVPAFITFGFIIHAVIVLIDGIELTSDCSPGRPAGEPYMHQIAMLPHQLQFLTR
jgi:hypothetical protein